MKINVLIQQLLLDANQFMDTISNNHTKVSIFLGQLLTIQTQKRSGFLVADMSFCIQSQLECGCRVVTAHTIWEIIAQKSLFEGFLTNEDDMACQHIGVLGPLPPEWQQKWDAHRDQLLKNGQPINEPQSLNQSWEDRFETCVQRPWKEEGMSAIEASERDALSSMLRSMLSLRPEDRPSAQRALKSEWMVKWALPEYEKICRTQ